GSKRQPPAEVVQQRVPAERQRLFGEAVAAALGFDFSAGRLDVSAHPFCTTVGAGDCPLTTHYRHHLTDAPFRTLHEDGHALHERGLARDASGTPLGEAASLGVHESQSRLWENLVGRSLPFWRRFYPLAQALYREALAGVPLETFHRAVNRVAPSLIRIQ